MKTLKDFRAILRAIERANNKAQRCYRANVQRLVDKHGIELRTGQLSDTWLIQIDGKWVAGYESVAEDHPFFKDLEKLDDLANDATSHRIGPSNMEHFSPKK